MVFLLFCKNGTVNLYR